MNQAFGSRYGFKITERVWGSSSSAKLINHLKNKGVVVGHVPGHFIAIVGYSSDGKFLVLDSFPTNARGTSEYGDWKTTSQMASGKLKLDWFCLINKTSSTQYFTKCAASHTSIVTALNSIGAESSYAYRKKIAAANNISNYTGTVSQNNQMLSMLKSGILKKP